MNSGYSARAKRRRFAKPLVSLALSSFYFTVSTALSLMNPAVVAVIVVLPTARPVATSAISDRRLGGITALPHHTWRADDGDGQRVADTRSSAGCPVGRSCPVPSISLHRRRTVHRCARIRPPAWWAH